MRRVQRVVPLLEESSNQYSFSAERRPANHQTGARCCGVNCLGQRAQVARISSESEPTERYAAIKSGEGIRISRCIFVSPRSLRWAGSCYRRRR